MKIVIATDAWAPQINGVVTTLGKMGEELTQIGNDVKYITPKEFKTFPCPSYPSIRLAILPKKKVRMILDDFKPDIVHIATEGPLGQAARSYCLKNNLKFTTSYHTQFPEYVRLRAPIPVAWIYTFLRRFHKQASRTMVPTPSQQQKLIDRNFSNVVVWPRGVDTELFKPRAKDFIDAKRPVSMYMGRVAVEKNIEAFLELDLSGTKYVIGDGPDLPALKKKYPDVKFTGFKRGKELAQYLAAADVFVFPSLTDTYGLVMLEAMACGVPVAAFPVTGPIDVVVQGKTGILDKDLNKAVLEALELNPQDCIAYAKSKSWRSCAKTFFNHLEPNLVSAK
ncbi:MAG: glycosyltransferase family 1 protein [Proteobacteria bacterium]|nr:glycosyltransferase family 1 protein [Pseudomonadota bacterium]NOG59761.1 glycosyltransferase family 1 protein [Pseudomonadota bacterium]